MKLKDILSPLLDIRAALSFALLPFLITVIKNPFLLLHPSKLSRLFFSLLWTPFSEGVDSAARSAKQGLVTPYAYGVVLDIGAGHGHTLDYLDHSRIKRYIALEPNEHMHSQISARAAKYGYTKEKDNFDIIPFGAEEIERIVMRIGGEHTIDTLATIMTLCSVPSPQKTVQSLIIRTLKPRGGQILFYEHVQSDWHDVKYWQSMWTPIWGIFFDGCSMNRPTHIWIRNSTEWNWDEGMSKMWTEESGESGRQLFSFRYGRFIRQ
ncbi:hypothetical protein SISSUDRAFT_988681 [Sistotremastrum suecicum HHB10207 ss-3]|uniref:S-adenosyl-L-methionine-dependent methyltransferase n=1 Tax=Sistotremastrum suecicum HHB10207 ss-3 TaxID=1314776 RepID=A0A166BVA4_9AGAM|nr:hypothetical protein SISSUDRAFT_988681 [Sistotremastrum suecicum HHB10207 ss-3]